MSTKSSGLFSPRRQLNFVELPFVGKIFYVDVRSNSLKAKLTERIKKLGGEIETFLSRDISLLITDKNENGSPENGTAKKQLSTGLPLSRGQALLLKASTANQENGKGSSSQTLLQNAASLGIKTQTATAFLRNTTKHLAKVKEQRKVADENEGLSPIVWDNEKENTPSSYIKVEDQAMIYRPLFKHLDSFPTINYTDTGCPFDTGFVLTKNNENIQAKKKAVGGALRGGYCESCDHWYKCTLREHLNSSRHRDFVESIENFKSLNKLTQKISNYPKFLACLGHGKDVADIDCDDEVGDDMKSLSIGPEPVRLVGCTNNPVTSSNTEKPAEIIGLEQSAYNTSNSQSLSELKECAGPSLELKLSVKNEDNDAQENSGKIIHSDTRYDDKRRVVLGELSLCSGNLNSHNPVAVSDNIVTLDSVGQSRTSASGYDGYNQSIDPVPQVLSDNKENKLFVLNKESQPMNSRTSVLESDKENLEAVSSDKPSQRSTHDIQFRDKLMACSIHSKHSGSMKSEFSEKLCKDISFNEVLNSIMNDSGESTEENQLLNAEIENLTTRQVHISESQHAQVVNSQNLTSSRLSLNQTENRPSSQTLSNFSHAPTHSQGSFLSHPSVQPSSEFVNRDADQENQLPVQIKGQQHLLQQKDVCSSEYQVPSTFPYQWTEHTSVSQMRPGSVTFSSSTSFGENGVNEVMTLLHSDQSSQCEPETTNYAGLHDVPSSCDLQSGSNYTHPHDTTSTCSGRRSTTSLITATTCAMMDNTDTSHDTKSELSLVAAASKRSMECSSVNNFETVDNVSIPGRSVQYSQDHVDDSYSSATERFSTKSYPSVGLSFHLKSACSTDERVVNQLQSIDVQSCHSGSCSSVYSQTNRSVNPLHQSNEHSHTVYSHPDVTQNVMKQNSDIQSRQKMDNIFEMFGKMDETSEPTPVKQQPVFNKVFSVANPDYSNITEDSLQGTSADTVFGKLSHVQSPLAKEGFKPFETNTLNACTNVVKFNTMNGIYLTPGKETTQNLQEKILDNVANSGSTIRNWLLPNGECDSPRSDGTLNTPVQKKTTNLNKSYVDSDLNVVCDKESVGQGIQSVETNGPTDDSSKVADWIQKQVFDPMLDSESSLQGFEDLTGTVPNNQQLSGTLTYSLKDKNIFESMLSSKPLVNAAEEITHKSCSEVNAESVHGDLTKEESDWSDSGTSISDCTLDNFRPSQDTSLNTEVNGNSADDKSADTAGQPGFRFREANSNKDWDNASVKSSLSSSVTSRGIKILGLKSLKQTTVVTTPHPEQQTDSVFNPADLLLQGLENCVKSSENNDTNSVISLSSALISEFCDGDNNSTKSGSWKPRKTKTKTTQKQTAKGSNVKKRLSPVHILPKLQPMACHLPYSNLHIQIPEFQLNSPQSLQSVDFLASPVQNSGASYRKMPQQTLAEHTDFLSSNSNFLPKNWQNQQTTNASANSMTSVYTMQFSDMSHDSASNQGFATIRLDDIAENSNSSCHAISNVASQNVKPSGVKSKRKMTVQKKPKQVNKVNHAQNIPSCTNSPVGQQKSDLRSSSQIFNQHYSACQYSQSGPTNHSQAFTSQAYHHSPSSQTQQMPTARSPYPQGDLPNPQSQNTRHGVHVQSNQCMHNSKPNPNILAPRQFQSHITQNPVHNPHLAAMNNQSLSVANSHHYGQIPAPASTNKYNQCQFTPSPQLSVNRAVFSEADVPGQNLSALHCTQPSMTAPHGYPLLGYMGSPVGTWASPGFQPHPHLSPANMYFHQTQHQQMQFQQAQLAHYQQQQATYNAVPTGDMKLTFRKIPAHSQNQTFEQGPQQMDLTKYWNVKKAGDCRLVFRVNPAVKRKVEEETPFKDTYYSNMPNGSEGDYQDGPITKRRRCLIY